MPGRPVMVKVSASPRTCQTLGFSPVRDFSSPPTTAQLPAPSGHKPQDAWPWGREAGQYLAIRGSSSNMVSSTLR